VNPVLELLKNSAALSPLPHERIPLVFHTAQLTGHPPLVSRSDTTPNGDPDMDNFGAPAEFGIPPSFFMVNPWEGVANPWERLEKAGEPPNWLTRAKSINDNPFRYVVRSEDSIRDITMAMLSSPGKKRESLTAVAKSIPYLQNPEDLRKVPTCRASSVTIPFACMAYLRETLPRLFLPDGTPLPASLGGPLVLDIGFTSSGYFALLAASQGVSSMAIDTQPHCSLWSQLAAKASVHSVGNRTTFYSALPFVPSTGYEGRASLKARVRTGCVGTWTNDEHVKYEDVKAYYDDTKKVIHGHVSESGEEVEDGGRSFAEQSRAFLQTEGAKRGLGSLGGSEEIQIPIASIDDILHATFDASPTILLLKMDTRGHEVEAMMGLERTLLKNPPLNFVLELNKRRTAIAMRLPSAVAAAASQNVKLGDVPKEEELVSGSPFHADFTLSTEDNAQVAGERVCVHPLYRPILISRSPPLFPDFTSIFRGIYIHSTTAVRVRLRGIGCGQGLVGSPRSLEKEEH